MRATFRVWHQMGDTLSTMKCGGLPRAMISSPDFRHHRAINLGKASVPRLRLCCNLFIIQTVRDNRPSMSSRETRHVATIPNVHRQGLYLI